MISKPLISVIVPTYNLQDYIGETIESILAQHYKNIEVIVVDDRSTDDTVAIINSYAEKDARIKFFTNHRRKGAAGARNCGIENASGEWIAFLDGDDLWEKSNLSEKMAVLDYYPNVQLITSDCYNENASNMTIRDSELHNIRQSDKPSWKKYCHQANETGEYLRLDNLVKIFIEDDVIGNTGVFLIKHELIKQVGLFDENMEVGEDVYLWIQLANRIDFLVYVPKPLMFYRYREGSLTNQGYPAHAFFAAIFFKKLLKSEEFKQHKRRIKKRISRSLMVKTYYFRKQGQKLKAIASAIESVCYDLGNFNLWKNLLATTLLF